MSFFNYDSSASIFLSRIQARSAICPGVIFLIKFSGSCFLSTFNFESQKTVIPFRVDSTRLIIIFLRKNKSHRLWAVV